ncbi:MAG: carbohydrate ABC transporter permease [Erysipelotrichaceae bacterium]|nr:carbohydrate ABC transporter permease [Erysipelotrichaceae bacterium]
MESKVKKRHSLLLIPLVLLMIYSVLPIVIMFLGSVKPSMALYKIPADLNPFTNLNLKNFANVFKKVPVMTALKNSLIYSGSIVLVTIVVGVTGGYAFAKKKFKFKNFWFVVMLATMMLPRQIMLIPNYMVAFKLHIIDKPIGLVLTSISSAYAIFLCRQFIAEIPNGLIEAAKMDGCSELGVFFKIILPISRPVIGSLAIFTFISSWNDFVWQNIMLTSKKNMTVPLMLAYLEGQTDAMNALGNKMAGAAISAIPMLIMFISFQKYFIKGITTGGIKE